MEDLEMYEEDMKKDQKERVFRIWYHCERYRVHFSLAFSTSDIDWYHAYIDAAESVHTIYSSW